MASSTMSQQQSAKVQPQVHASAQPLSPAASAPLSFSAAAGRQRGAPNGASSVRPPKTQQEPKQIVTQSKDTTAAEHHARDRLLFLLAHFVGNIAHVTVKNGDQFSGIFSSASIPQDSSEPQQYVLKMVKRQHQESQQANGVTHSADDYVGYGEDHTMVFDIKDVAHVNVSDVVIDKVPAKMPNGLTPGFKTDVDISGNLAGRERELQRWDAGGDATLDMSFTDNGRPWDQFEVNERLYGLRTDYDETMYTTAIDKTAPDYSQRLATADRIAREIEGSATTDMHVAEERGQSMAVDNIDEEDRFSGVKRDFPTLASNQANAGKRYTPPARRAPAGQVTVPGAPVDPAIISSQLARPDFVSKSSRNAATSPVPLVQANVPKKENVDPLIPSQETRVDGNSSNNVAEEGGTISQNAAEKTPTTPKPEQGSITVPNSAKSVSRSNALPTTALPNNTANVEREVLNEFRNFAAREKMSISERQRMSARKEREVKLNDLKKFASNFKLKSAVPLDMLGILAKDKQKQVEIVEKSQLQLSEQLEPGKASASTKAPEKTGTQGPDPIADASQVSAVATVEKVNGKTSRSTQPLQTSFNPKDRTSQPTTGPIMSPKAGTGTLGQRLMQQQNQLRDRALQSFSGPSTGGLYGSRNGSISANTPTTAARLNVQAVEFRPNPTAVSFSPSAERSSGAGSPLRTRNQSVPQKVLNRTSFFEGKRPDRSTKKSIKDGFNPIKRMKKEVEAGPRAKDYAANGGIPQPYRTPPTWDATDEYKDKTHVDVLENPPSHSQSVSPMPLAHQHQLPLHLQQGPHVMGQSNHVQHVAGFPQQQHMRGGDHRFDEHRMQYSGSQSSQFPSPRMPQIMLPYNQQIMGQIQPHLGQAIAPFPYAGTPPQVGQLRQYPAQFIGSPGMATPVVLQPGSGPFMGVPVHAHGPMFSPAQAHVLPAHIMGQHNTIGPNGYPSPRGAQMMMHQGSQQGHVTSQQVYMNAGQHPLYAAQHQSHTPHMRGGIPMSQQPSFGGNSSVPQHYPGAPQRQYSQMGNNYAAQAMDHGMSQQHHPPPAAVNGGGEDSK